MMYIEVCVLVFLYIIIQSDISHDSHDLVRNCKMIPGLCKEAAEAAVAWITGVCTALCRLNRSAQVAASSELKTGWIFMLPFVSH